MPGPRKSDIGGEVTSSSVGANVKILWREEELERVHFPLLQVPWSFVGRLRDEAEKNENQGMMTVDLATLRQDGVPIFNDDFPSMFREVFVRRFIPCLNEKFNQRDPNKPLTKLPEDVCDALRLLVLCERLKAALKQDVKDHLDRLLVRASERVTRPNESAPFKILQTSLEIDATVPPKGTLQERVVQRATETLAGQLPDSLEALQELVQMCCELQRGEMCIRLFRASTEKALMISGKLPSTTSNTHHHKTTSTRGEEEESDRYETIQDSKRVEMERNRITQEWNKIAQEKEKNSLERERNEQERKEIRALRAEHQHKGSRKDAMMEPLLDESINEENSFDNGQDQGFSGGKSLATHGLYAFNQGVILEKVGKNTGDRILRISGDALEWRKGSGRFTKEHTVFRQDVVSLKVVDPQGRTFLLSTKTGLLTLRALSEPAANMFLQAIDQWVKGQNMKLKRTPISTPSQIQQQTHTPSIATSATPVTSRRFPRISMSFKRNNKPETQMGIPLTGLAIPNPSRAPMDFSFTSNLDSSIQEDD